MANDNNKKQNNKLCGKRGKMRSQTSHINKQSRELSLSLYDWDKESREEAEEEEEEDQNRH